MRLCLQENFFLFRNRFFDADGYLFLHRLKIYWSSWTGHPNRMTTLELFTILSDLACEKMISGFTLDGRGSVNNSSDSTIHPLNSPKDQHHYNPIIHPPKKVMKFQNRIFKEVIALLAISDSYVLVELEKKIELDQKLFDSRFT